MKNTSMIWKWLILGILAALSIYVVVTPPGGAEQAAKTVDPAEQTFLQKFLPGIRLGIDLAGGTSFTVEVDKEKLQEDIADANPKFTDKEILDKMDESLRNADDRVLEVLRKRVDGMGVNEPVIFKGKDRIVIQLPGADAEQRAMAERSIESAAFLEFRLVHRENDRLALELLGKPAPRGFKMHESGQGYVPAADYATLYRDPEYRRYLSRFGCERVSNHSLMMERTSRRGQGEMYVPTFVSNRRELDGSALRSAGVSTDMNTGGLQINLQFNSDGARLFRLVTAKHRPHGSDNQSPDGRRLAIILDGILYSAPTIKNEIAGGQAQITGQFSIIEANMLANTLNAGALPIPVKIVEKRVIDPTLGRDAINSGLYAAAGGALLVFLFMLVYYFYCGFLANVALTLDILLLPAGMIIAAGCLSFFDTSVDASVLTLPVFTMPGIAGIVLTIGMATDANVLVFERIREEFRLGKSARAAVSAGYDRAFLAILDANLTTLITAVILFVFGTGPIKGFAITLSAGVLISMFTILVVMRMILDLTVPEGRIEPYKMLEWIKPDVAFDFLGKARPAIIGTSVFIAATLLLFGIKAANNPSSVMAIDFTGGISIEYAFDKDQPAPARGDIEAALDKAGINAEAQYQGTFEGDRIMLVRTTVETADAEGALPARIQSALDEAFPSAAFQEKASDTIGSSVGADMRKSAFKAIVFALLAMSLYITLRFEFGFALGTLVSLAVNVLFTVGLFSLMGRQISLTAVAGLLTIVGYAINDCIVVFDRIREDLGKDQRTDFKALINQACNRTLSRTVLTSVTTLFPVVALVLFASGAIFDFALIMCIGIIFGTFATLFIATPVMTAWYRGRRPGFDAAKKKFG